MSLHKLRPRRRYKGYDIAVGWDRMLRTYFVQVTATDAAKHSGVLKVLPDGCDKIRYAEDAIAEVMPYARIPKTLLGLLEDDRDPHLPAMRELNKETMKKHRRWWRIW